MAIFKVGQKAKMVNCENAPNHGFRNCNGDEVTIIGGLGVVFDGDYQISRPRNCTENGTAYFASSRYLSPMTDPLAEQFIARLEKLGREPVSSPEKVTT